MIISNHLRHKGARHKQFTAGPSTPTVILLRRTAHVTTQTHLPKLELHAKLFTRHARKPHPENKRPTGVDHRIYLISRRLSVEVISQFFRVPVCKSPKHSAARRNTGDLTKFENLRHTATSGEPLELKIVRLADLH